MSNPAFAAHFNGSRFYNPNGEQVRGLAEVLRWKLSSRPEPSPRFVSDVKQSLPPRRVQKDELLATLVNHSTVLLQQNATNILTDPIWSERTSPVAWAGPRRHRKPGVRMEDLPEIDLVLLSHDHYDHLDLPTLRRLAARGNCTFIAPKGVGKLLRSEKIAPVHELDWGEAWSLGSTSVSCVPAYHFSGRGLFDRNRTLWCGYVIGTPGAVVYFAADTAFGDHFAQIRAKFGSPRLALLPIGAYKPTWFMSSVHMSPAEAIEAHRIVGAAMSIAIHHGTFQLADEGLDTAKKEFMACAPPASFLVPENGQPVAIP